MNHSSRDREQFAAIFRELSHRVYAYARRQTHAADAEDVVAETFLVAWRRYETVPVDNPLPWLLAVARNVLRNHGPSVIRDDHLAAAWAAAQPAATIATDEDVAERDLLFGTLVALSEREREAVLLIAWDGLTAAQAATVAGCSQKALEVRLARGRSRIARCLLAEPDPPGALQTTPMTREAM